MKKLNFVSNLNVNEFSGGWSAMNHNVFLELQKRYIVNVIDNISPKYNLSERIISKILRTVNIKAPFPAFTESRLKEIKKLVESNIDKSADITFFHGSTSWLHIENTLPYFAYLDACFATYINVYHNMHKFSKKQLHKLFHLEAIFLTEAKAIFFSSNWALEDTKKHYKLDGKNFHCVGLGGGMKTNPLNISSQNVKPYLLFISWDFLGKRGDKLVQAFNHFQKKYDNPFKLKIVGQAPPDLFLNTPDIEYIGKLNKKNPHDLQKLVDLFINAYCFILPSSKDMTPLVLIEAASLGCPVISVDNFGISEIVKNEETGILINPEPGSIDTNLIDSITRLYLNKTERDNMGSKARQRIQDFFTWEQVGEKIFHLIETF